MKNKILIIDDEINILELLKLNLEIYGYDVLTYDTGEGAVEEIEKIMPNLILLDLMLPGMSGIEICKKIRMNPKLDNIRILILSAKSDQIDKVLCLELGADDYITKPFGLRELIARIGATFRRINAETTPVEKSGNVNYQDLEINIEDGKVYRGDEEIELTVKELKLFIFLLENRGTPVGRDEIIERVWQNKGNQSRSLDVHIRKLRKKLNDKNNSYIETVRGLGYMVP